MTALLQCHRLSHSAGTKSLFKRLDLTINTGDRIGLVGHNGSGKSTLLSILDGNLEPDDGDISRNNGLQLETVEQFIDPRLNSLNLFAALSEKLPDEIRTASQYKADQLLAQLGFEETEYEFLVSDLSGGQQNRLMFARAVINEPNLILFDEPTNHLDLKTLLLFEEFLKNLRAAFLIISHDREFLDAVTTRTVFLRDERLYYYSQPFSRARQALDEFDTASEAAREVEEKNIKRLAASAHRLAVWGRVYDNEKIARKAKNMEKRVERLKDERTFVTQGSGLNLTLDVGSAHANRMLHIEGQMIHAPGGPGEKEPLFFIEDFMIRPGERVALLGHNGTGKTTLINLIMEHYQVDKDGDLIKFNPQCQIGYYDQELALLNPAHSMTETLRDRCGGADNTLKSALIKAGFPYLDLDKKVAVLSGGEKARLMFLIIKLNQPNFLILDEPTNHIDIQGKEELEVQILETNATVLITSHDRRFVDQIADRFLLIDNQQLREINDPQAFYRQTKRTRQATGADVPTGEEKQHSRAEDDILARIVELETLLEQDLARKPKFQKLKLQVSWQEEIDTLNKLL